jgi:small-conductance mechanosensitive channel
MDDSKQYDVKKLKKIILKIIEENKSKEKSQQRYPKALQTLKACLNVAEKFKMTRISVEQLTSYNYKEITHSFLDFIEEIIEEQKIDITPSPAQGQIQRPKHFAQHYLGMVYGNDDKTFAPIFMEIDDFLNVSIEGFYIEYKGKLCEDKSNVYIILKAPENKDSPSFVILYTNIFGAVGYKVPIRIFVMNVNFTNKEEGTLCSDYVVFFKKSKEDFEKLLSDYTKLREEIESAQDEIKRQHFLKEKCLNEQEYAYAEKLLTDYPTVCIKPTYHDYVPALSDTKNEK